MADLKISELTNLTAADPANDMIPIVDVSATPPASGSTKRISINNILACSPSATLASATITGNLTVDTNTLFVDAANNRVGVGTTSPVAPLDVRSNGNIAGLFLRTTDPAAAVSSAYIQAPVSSGFSSTVPIYGFWYQNSGMGNPAADTLNWIIGSAESMRLNSTGLGVGGSPVTSHLISAQGPIAVGGTAGGTRTSYISNSGAASIYYTDGGASYPFNEFGNLVIQPRTSAARSVVIATGSTTPVERAVVKSTGQVRFVPLAADPSGAEAGDVYYNSTSNKLKCYNGSTWNDLF